MGRTKFEESRLVGFVEGFNQYLVSVKNLLPNIEPALDYNGNPTFNSVALTLGFRTNRISSLLIPYLWIPAAIN